MPECAALCDYLHLVQTAVIFKRTVGGVDHFKKKVRVLVFIICFFFFIVINYILSVCRHSYPLITRLKTYLRW